MKSIVEYIKESRKRRIRMQAVKIVAKSGDLIYSSSFLITADATATYLESGQLPKES